MRNFDSILVDPFMISYTNPREAPEGPARTLDEKTEKHVPGLMRNIFIDQMGRSREFEVVEEPGLRTIRVPGWLYDIFVEEPPREDPRFSALLREDESDSHGPALRDSRAPRPCCRSDQALLRCRPARTLLFRAVAGCGECRAPAMGDLLQKMA